MIDDPVGLFIDALKHTLSGESLFQSVRLDLSALSVMDYERMVQAGRDEDLETVIHIVDKATPEVDIRELNIILLRPLLDAFQAALSKQMQTGAFALLYSPVKEIEVDLGKDSVDE